MFKIILLFLLTIIIMILYRLNYASDVTHFNSDYQQKMIHQNKPLQETPWGFQEISLKETTKHYINSIQAYKQLLEGKTNQTILNKNGLQWKDKKVHIIHFEKGTYLIPRGSSYFTLLVPSETIILGAGIQKTIFKATHELESNDPYHFRKLFNLEYATHDVVIKDISFYNETRDNKWGLIHANGNFNRENYLFENIEFDDVFGAVGKKQHLSNFITFRGLTKRIGNTTKRIQMHFNLPLPINYQFYSNNQDNVELAGQIGVRNGNSVVFHDCELGDTISATTDIYSNYIEMVGIKFINPLLDHSIKTPSGNHLYVHDSTFELTYTTTLINNDYWNPTFFTHEGGGLPNYHFKNLKFKRAGQISFIDKTGQKFKFIESEPFMLHNNRPENISGDVIWENIVFEGYSPQHQIVGYPNVQTSKGYEAINYTPFKAMSAQLRAGNNNSRGNFQIEIKQALHSSKEEIKGVYSWGIKKNGSIDYPRDNRLFIGNKKESINQPYVLMKYSTTKNSYNQFLFRTPK